MIDTCFVMRDEFTDFIESIEMELLHHKKKIVVKSVVLAELYRHLGSTDDVVRTKATRAVETIHMKRKVFDLDEDNVTTEEILKAFADVEFISYFAKNRISQSMALLTNDYKLGKDIVELNNLRSCYGKKVEVFLLNKYGNLEEHTCHVEKRETTKPTKEVIDNIDYLENDKKNSSWVSYLVCSIASFTMGYIVDKYAKKIMNSLTKTVA